MLREQQRRAQIDRDELVEQSDVDRLRRIVLEDRRVVDKNRQRAERRRRGLDNARRLLGIREFGSNDNGPAVLFPQMRG